MFSLTPYTMVKREHRCSVFSVQPKRDFRYLTSFGINRCRVFFDPLVMHIMTFTMIDSSGMPIISQKSSISGHVASKFPFLTFVCCTYPWYLYETKHPSPFVNFLSKGVQKWCSSFRISFMKSWSCAFTHLSKSKILQVCVGKYFFSSNSKSISRSLVKSPSDAISTRASITRGLIFIYGTAPVADYWPI